MTKIELELVPEPDMYIFFEKGARSKKNQNITYLDANNLYGYVMSKFHSTSKFKWIVPKEFDLHKYTSSRSKGCDLAVDLEELQLKVYQIEARDVFIFGRRQ